MRLDHLSYAAGPDGLEGTAERIGAVLGRKFTDGGVHPRFGTRNMTLPLAGNTYLEVVEALDHPASDKAPFGQAVKARSALGGGWLGWVVAVTDISRVEARLGRSAAIGSRHRPDGTERGLETEVFHDARLQLVHFRRVAAQQSELIELGADRALH
ncbi:MAG: VOC family protein, partial [Nocardioides sp.]|nr:VOC family protein [Nocardioides sp.]